MMAHTFATMRVSCRVWRDTFASASVVVAIVDSLFASARYFVANQARASLEKGLLMPDPLPRLLGQAQYALDLGSQGELGELLGASRRSGQRWAVGRASPSGPQFEDLVRRVYEVDKDLAAQLAAARQTTLLAMGVVAPSAPPFVPPADRVADSVLCAAAEAMDVSPRAIRPAIHAAFTRARELGLTVEAMEKALRGGAPTAAAADGKKKR
jgi:hypothetical protein